jgi:hypothetical protein
VTGLLLDSVKQQNQERKEGSPTIKRKNCLVKHIIEKNRMGEKRRKKS